MSRPHLPLKLYYRIGEVSEVVGVETHVLRYWESEFSSIRPQKSPKGQRIYSRKDVEKLLAVKDLLYTQGYTVAGAKKRLRELTRTPGGLSVAQESGSAVRTAEAPRAEAKAPETKAPEIRSTVSAARAVERAHRSALMDLRNAIATELQAFQQARA